MIYLALILLGLALGSFTNAVVWRLHQQSSVKSKKALQELSIAKGRSMCPDCRHTLSWFDLLPIISWLMVAGRCRYCKKRISIQYPLVELLVAILLVTSWYAWPFLITNIYAALSFAFWCGCLMLLVALFLYDLKWMLLPNRLVYPLIVSASGSTIFGAIAKGESFTHTVTSSVAGMLVLGGFFWLIYQVSRGKWIGGGDVRLGFALGLLLGGARSVVCLTAAAYLACIVIVILALLSKYHRNMKLPFGPFLITAAYGSLLWGQLVVDFYKRISGL